jgi:hypothetical protein
MLDTCLYPVQCPLLCHIPYKYSTNSNVQSDVGLIHVGKSKVVVPVQSDVASGKRPAMLVTVRLVMSLRTDLCAPAIVSRILGPMKVRLDYLREVIEARI